MIAVVVVVVVVVNCEGPTLLGVTLDPAVRIIIVCVDKVKGPMISGVRSLDTAVVITIIVK